MTVPFYPNVLDGTYCWQAALQMVLAKFDHEYSMNELIKISGKKEGEWTWPTKTLLWLNENGYKTKLIEDFSFEEFASDGIKYIENRFGKEVATVQAKMSDIPTQQILAKKYSKIANLEKRPATKNDIIELLNNNYLLIVNINAAKLLGIDDYSAHFIVIFDANENDIIFHDPGLPPKPNTKVAWNKFIKAWAYPTENDKNLLAIKKG